MGRLSKKWVVTVVAVGLTLVMAGTALAAGNGRGNRGGAFDGAVSGGAGVESHLQALPQGELSAEEQADLLFMYEEEKTARDVYLSFHDQWGARIFKNIAASEQRHMDAVKNLLDRYAVPDPGFSEEIGVFHDTDLQKLYDDLLAQGSGSLQAARDVGRLIEEVDIEDLEQAIARSDNADIDQVYANLLRGSENHLRAFSR